MGTICVPIFFRLNICHTHRTWQTVFARIISFFLQSYLFFISMSLTRPFTSADSHAHARYHREKRLERGCIFVGRVPHGNSLISDEKAFKLNLSEGGKDTQHVIAKYKLNNYLPISSSSICCTSQWYKSIKIFFSCVNIPAGLLQL